MSFTDIPPVVGLRGIEHIGLTVPDMGQALDFFSDVLAAEMLFEVGPVRAEDNWMAVNLGVDADTVIPRIVMIRIGRHGPTLELFEYEHPDNERHPPKQSAVGGQHIAFYVEDIEAGVTSLRAHSVIVLGEPKSISDGPQAGLHWVHFLAPWGQQLELVSYPAGIAAYADRVPAVWMPGSELSERSGDVDSGISADPTRDTDAELDTDSA